MVSEPEYFFFRGVTYDVTFGESDTIRHGGPFDRGSADSYYGRGIDPHYWPLGTGKAFRIEKEFMSEDQIQEYFAGHEYNETVNMDFKDWG